MKFSGFIDKIDLEERETASLIVVFKYDGPGRIPVIVETEACWVEEGDYCICSYCGKPCGMIHDLNLSSCCFMEIKK